jgi:hypothetical protein
MPIRRPYFIGRYAVEPGIGSRQWRLTWCDESGEIQELRFTSRKGAVQQAIVWNAISDALARNRTEQVEIARVKANLNNAPGHWV